jgi:type I restriction enzyme S subunit
MGGGNMSSRKVKLGDVLIKKNLRLKDVPELKDPLVLGVTNNEGVVKSKVDAGQKIEDYYVIEKGDFVYNPYRINVGSIGISELEGITSLAYVVFNVDEARLNKYLLFKLLKSDFGIKEIIRNGRGSVRNALRFDDLARIELTLPSIEEQNAFVESFRQKEVKLELLKNHYTYQLSLLENLNQAILQEAVQGKLVPQDHNDEPASELLKRIKVEKAKSNKKEKPLPPIKPEEIPFKIPENWVWCRLGEIADIVRGGSPRPAGDKTYYDGDIPFLKVADLTSGNEVYLYEHTYTIKEAGLNKTRFVEANTLMLTNSGATLGYPKICTFPTTFNDGIAAFLNLSENLDKVYLFYFLKSLTSWFLKVASRGQGQPNLNTDIIGLTLFPIPPNNEQKRIVSEIENQFAKTKQLKEHILANQQATEQLLKALLHQAFEVREMETTII